MNQYVQGAFCGALVLCILMLNFPEHKTCEVSWGDLNHTHIRVGIWNE